MLYTPQTTVTDRNHQKRPELKGRDRQTDEQQSDSIRIPVFYLLEVRNLKTEYYVTRKRSGNVIGS